MKTIPFLKMSGSGNDFIIIDNREAVVPEAQLMRLVIGACRRKMSVGADGMIFIESSANFDFKWRFFNADGSLPDMCGNGARCAARFAFIHGIADRQMAFETLAGTIEATVGDNTVKIRMTEPRDLKTGTILDIEGTPTAVGSVNTGVPHVVMVVDDVEAVAVAKTGRLIRYHPKFAPDGTNANFVAVKENGTIFIRTYERGVEDETLACGTGNVAAALILACERGLTSPVTLTTRSGGKLTVHFKTQGCRYQDVLLEGDARVIYRGDLWEEAWRS
ncbi:diaminopimelate epimerase [Desulfosarcina sp.]|uniref:diaminopimelate epimerase n=1 Tax=Desulfosarcina sp. TaxID=2027861 RepID=UPI0029A3DF15|nr:diaminopimelate epimerase [Desulfosarcina sp.]MDX2455818.1 diaminopimelate epimerase [Desulfosarcina sp.]MDX2493280.1 diaminopimelate epimerase [Desulfosarcina sp.]